MCVICHIRIRTSSTDLFTEMLKVFFLLFYKILCREVFRTVCLDFDVQRINLALKHCHILRSSALTWKRISLHQKIHSEIRRGRSYRDHSTVFFSVSEALNEPPRCFTEKKYSGVSFPIS